MNTLSFHKMHALGNDFMVIDSINSEHHVSRDMISSLADRHQGVGFDQLLLLTKSPNADVHCVIYNADGSEAEQCGNGLRCVARYLKLNRHITNNECTISTIAGTFSAVILNDHEIEITLPLQTMQFATHHLNHPNLRDENEVYTVQIGNPHVLLSRTLCLSAPTEALAAAIVSALPLPEGGNVGFYQLISRDELALQTFERGAGETLACGSNACAAALAGIYSGQLNHTVNIHFQFGSLKIAYHEDTQEIKMTGPATYVFRGEIMIGSL